MALQLGQGRFGPGARQFPQGLDLHSELGRVVLGRIGQTERVRFLLELERDAGPVECSGRRRRDQIIPQLVAGQDLGPAAAPAPLGRAAVVGPILGRGHAAASTRFRATAIASRTRPMWLKLVQSHWLLCA